MAKIAEIISNLREERTRTAKELQQLDQAIGALSRLDGLSQNDSGRAKRSGNRRVLSAAARRRISAAKKAWWAKRKKAA